MTPSVGRMVHYVSYGTPGGEYPSVCRAAIITEVTGLFDEDGTDREYTGYAVSLAVLNPEGMFFNRNVDQCDERKGGTWHWPERVQ